MVDVRTAFSSKDGVVYSSGVGCRWLHEPQPTSSPSVGLEFPHRTGRYRPGGPPFLCFSPVCCCTCMDGFLIREWDPILPGCRWLYEVRAPGWVFHSVRGGIDPRDHRYRPRFDGVVDVWKDSRSGDGTLSFPGGAGSTNPVRVSTPCGGVSALETTVFVPGLLEPNRMYRRILIRGWDLILPLWHWLYESQVEVSTACGATSTQGTTMFVPSKL